MVVLVKLGTVVTNIPVEILTHYNLYFTTKIEIWTQYNPDFATEIEI